MAGGTFDKSVGKVRPGTYINFEASNQSTLGSSDRGTVLIPLINHSYGPEKEFITTPMRKEPEQCCLSVRHLKMQVR